MSLPQSPMAFPVTSLKITLLKITLVDSVPAVWRQVIVPAEITLATLHRIVQSAMGWENQHGYRFQLGISQPPCDHQLPLSQAFLEAQKGTEAAAIYYTYDLRCGWLHRLETEAIDVSTTDLQSTRLPRCIDGAAACPPEGSGGVWGYDEWLAKLEDSEDPDYLDLIAQYGDFDPDKFDLVAANVRLSSLL